MSRLDYIQELHKLLDEARVEMLANEAMSLSPERSIRMAYILRKERLILDEIDEVEKMTNENALSYRFAVLLRSIDAVGG